MLRIAVQAIAFVALMLAGAAAAAWMFRAQLPRLLGR
jgi:hypothetical protein